VASISDLINWVLILSTIIYQIKSNVTAQFIWINPAISKIWVNFDLNVCCSHMVFMEDHPAHCIQKINYNSWNNWLQSKMCSNSRVKITFNVNFTLEIESANIHKLKACWFLKRCEFDRRDINRLKQILNTFVLENSAYGTKVSNKSSWIGGSYNNKLNRQLKKPLKCSPSLL
jgi:hypothetical protein